MEPLSSLDSPQFSPAITLTMSCLESIGKIKLFCLKVFRIFGFSPLSLNIDSPLTHYPLLIWSFILLIINVVKLWVGYMYHESILYSGDKIGEFHDSAKLIVLFLAHQTILLEAVFKRKGVRSFYSKLITFQQIYPFNTGQYSKDNTERSVRYVLKFTSLVTYSTFAGLVVVLLQFYTRFFLIWSFENSNYFAVCTFHFYCILLLDIVHLELINLNTELKSLLKFTNDIKEYNCSGKFTDYIHVRIRNAQKGYHLLFEMAEDLNHIFGLSWTMLILCNLVVYQCHLYWLNWQIYRETANSIIGNFWN